MSNYLELTFEIFDEQEQRASVRESLTVGNMIEEIIKEFDDLDTGNLGSFALYLKGDDKTPHYKYNVIILFLRELPLFVAL